MEYIKAGGGQLIPASVVCDIFIQNEKNGIRYAFELKAPLPNSAINTYCDNFCIEPSLNFGDITKIKELPYHDLLTAGVPCQSWSIAGKNLGFDDDRGQLWNDTIYLLQQSKP